MMVCASSQLMSERWQYFVFLLFIYSCSCVYPANGCVLPVSKWAQVLGIVIVGKFRESSTSIVTVLALVDSPYSSPRDLHWAEPRTTVSKSVSPCYTHIHLMSCPSTNHVYLFIAIIYKKYYQKEEREKAEGDSQKTDHLRWRWWLMDVYTRTLVPRGKKKSGIHATVEGGGGTGWATSPAEDDEREREVFDEWAVWVSEPGVLNASWSERNGGRLAVVVVLNRPGRVYSNYYQVEQKQLARPQRWSCLVRSKAPEFISFSALSLYQSGFPFQIYIHEFTTVQQHHSELFF